MDTNEISLVNLARKNFHFHDPNEISVIIQVETEFSRIIFMKGDDLYTVSPIINESFNPEIVVNSAEQTEQESLQVILEALDKAKLI